MALFCVITATVALVHAQAISEDARRHMARGKAALETTKGSEDYEDAIREFDSACKSAPDWPEPYYNLGVVQGKAGKYEEAARSLRRYLDLQPDAKDARAVKDLVYDFEYKGEKARTEQGKSKAMAGIWERFDPQTGEKFDSIEILPRANGLDVKVFAGFAGAITVPAQFDGRTLRFRFVSKSPTVDVQYSYEMSLVSQEVMQGPMNSEVLRTSPTFPVKAGRKNSVRMELRRRQ